MHKIKEAYKKKERHWQHKDTGHVCIATFKPSNRWYQINKKQYEDYLCSQKAHRVILCEIEGCGKEADLIVCAGHVP